MLDMRLMIAIVAGYLIGSIPVAGLLARRHGVELRVVGDRNPGYWNAKETLGRRAALPVFVGDLLKGVASGVVGVALVPGWTWALDGLRVWDRTGTSWTTAYAAIGAAMVGHAWPLFARFKGGRSILTFVGGMVVVTPVAVAIGVAAIVAETVRPKPLAMIPKLSFAWAARIGIFTLPVLQLLVHPASRVAATGLCMSIIGLRFALAASRRPRTSP
jgi:acyl phosphate:glycerol-3-phosphate acyltransferase